MTRVIQDLMHLGAISFDDLTEARLLIQSGVVRLACERATKADIEAIGPQHRRDGRNDAPWAGHDERLRYAMEFYRLLALSTRNEILTILVDALTDILLRFLRGPRRRARRRRAWWEIAPALSSGISRRATPRRLRRRSRAI